MMKTRACNRCHQQLPVNQFSRSAVAADGLHTWCKPCKAAKTRAWYAENKAREQQKDRSGYAVDGTRQREQAKAWHWANRARSLASKRHWKLKKYGLSNEDYERMHAAQEGLCVICRQPQEVSKYRRELAVDHCHATGDVRGLLCHHCNVGIGHFEDSPELLRSAADYLERTKARRSA